MREEFLFSSNPSHNVAFTDLFNKVHVGESPQWIHDNIPETTISLTLTSPPVYDDNLYVERDGTPEFGWKDYDEYIDHIEGVMAEVLRVTTPGGILAIDTSSAPREEGNVALDLFTIPADITKRCVRTGWYFHSEVIWEKDKYLYKGRHLLNIPQTFVRQKHDQLLIFRKEGEAKICGESVEIPSVWRFPRDSDRKDIRSYTRVYSTFPDEMVRRVLQLWSCPGDIVLDPYAGSGQVVRVAKEMGRYGIGVEYHEKWRGIWKDLA